MTFTDPRAGDARVLNVERIEWYERDPAQRCFAVTVRFGAEDVSRRTAMLSKETEANGWRIGVILDYVMDPPDKSSR